ncbi:hypothetical protein DRP07_11450 [Archaeoglobales archaeon]|nr:MAG: hypothetical protein DRP07_11450 [Archaeoglobales archaeon]
MNEQKKSKYLELEINRIEDTLIPRPWPIIEPKSKEEIYAPWIKDPRDPDGKYGEFIEENISWEKATGKPWALDGLLVIDCTIWSLSGAICGSFLGELGATVIKIEPLGGDPLRYLYPFSREEYAFEDIYRGEKVSPTFIHEQRNKYSITLNLEHPKGRELFKKLVNHADIVLENYPPGTFDDWEIGYRHLSQINPRIIYCWFGQLGQWGPMKDKTSKHGQMMLDPIGLCCSEFVHSTGFPADLLPREKGGNPTRAGEWTADLVAGVHTAVGILAALYYRENVSNRGQFIEATSSEAYIEVNDFNIGWYGYDGSIKARTGGWDPCLNQYAWNPCKDGYMMIGGQTDRLWYRILQVLAEEDPEGARLIAEDPFLKEMAARNALEGLIKTYTITAQWLAKNTRAEAEKKMVSREVAAAPVLMIDEIAEYEHFVYRRHVTEVYDEHYGRVLIANSPLAHQHRTPARVKWLGRPLGLDNGEIFTRYLGLGPSELKKLAMEGVTTWYRE